MPLQVGELEVAVRRLSELRKSWPCVLTGALPELGGHVANELATRIKPLQAEEYYKAAMSYIRATTPFSATPPSREEMLAVAKAVFPEEFVREVEEYIIKAELDRARQEGGIPH
ncbi:hypothetical protein HZA33_02055 [Candidatus Pacearchaeota archaeon]|nr:hypothetical protein [Candidatus Pacearchaeota archaeon]